MRTNKITTAAALAIMLSGMASQAQIFTPSGTIQGSSFNNSVGIGNVSLPLSNKLVISDAINNGGLLKLMSSANQPNDKWWIGFGHGTGSTDADDRARIGVQIQGGGAGNLFFTTGSFGSQSERMRIMSGGVIGIGTTTPSNLFQLNVVSQVSPSLGQSGGISASSTVLGSSNNIGLMADAANASFNSGVIGVARGGSQSTGGSFDASSTSDATGVSCRASGTNTAFGGVFDAGAPRATGVFARALGGRAFLDRGTAGEFFASGSGYNTGIKVDATTTAGNSANTGAYITANQFGGSGAGSNNYGVIVNAITHSEASINTGILTRAQVSGTNCTNYGIRAEIDGGVAAPDPNFPTGAGSYAGYFYDVSRTTGANGAAFFNGTMVTTGGMTAVSDKKFKDNITHVDGALSRIMQLAPVSYTFKGRDAFPSFTFPQGKQYGFIAQELEKVIPELVKEVVNPAMFDSLGKKTVDAVKFKGVNYTELIPVLVAGIQEQQALITAKDEKISELEARIQRLEANTATGLGNNGTTTDKAASLSQNVPNPFEGVTEIRYTLPKVYSSANILVFDMNGKQLRSMPLQGAGEGKVQFSGSELTAGMYLYSLMVDGLEIDTKRMILSCK